MFLFALLALFGAMWWFIHLHHRIAKSPSNPNRKLPPGPRGLPIIGNLHMLGKLPPRTLHKLSKKYGPLMSLRLGNVPTIVVSSPVAAELILKKHDSIFASRPYSQATNLVTYGSKGIGFAPYGSYWRNVKKFCTLELLSNKKSDTYVGMRREELRLFVEDLKEAAEARVVVDVSEKVGRLVEHMICGLLFGKFDYKRLDLSGILKEITDLVGAFNIADYLPLLGVLDIQGLTRRMKKTTNAIDKILEVIIDEHERNPSSSNHKEIETDFVDVLLSLEKRSMSTTSHDQLSHEVSRENIKAILLDLMFAAIETSSASIEWAISELLRHPREMKQLKQELRTKIGDNEMVEESYLPNLEYLDMVVKESMRLHPPAPLLLPHESLEDIMIDGYYIAKHSRIIVNVWALGRDCDSWSGNVEEFMPERFSGSDIDLRGQNFELIPFGSGRRLCPGMHVGLNTVHLVVAQMMHCFDWELPNDMLPSALNMDESFGVTMGRASPLLATPHLRFESKAM